MNDYDQSNGKKDIKVVDADYSYAPEIKKFDPRKLEEATGIPNARLCLVLDANMQWHALTADGINTMWRPEGDHCILCQFVPEANIWEKVIDSEKPPPCQNDPR